MSRSSDLAKIHFTCQLEVTYYAGETIPRLQSLLPAEEMHHVVLSPRPGFGTVTTPPTASEYRVILQVHPGIRHSK
jgi:hypothetical protein